MNDLTTINPEVLGQLNEAIEFSKSAKSLVIENNAQYDNALNIAKKAKALSSKLEESRKSLTRPIDDQKKAIMDKFREPVEALSQLEKMIKNAMVAYGNKMAALAREAEEKALAEAKRLEDERKKELEAKAQASLDSGNDQEALQLLDQVDQVFTPIVVNVPQVPTAGGVAKKELWTYEVVDLAKVPREYLVINDVMLKALAKSTKGSLKIDGIRFYSESSLAIGR